MSKLALTDPRSDEFNGAYLSGMNSLVKAGKVLCTWFREDPRIFQVIQRDYPLYTDDILKALVRVGERTLHPILAMDTSPGAKRLATLPYDVQERFVGTRVEVLVTSTSGAVERTKPITLLTKKEAALVFDDSGNLRTIGEQRRCLRRVPGKLRVTGGGGGGRSRTLDEVSSDEPSPANLHDEETVSSDLDASPKSTLKARLQRIQNDLLECRSDLALICGPGKGYDNHDRFISSALNSVGVLRLVVAEDRL